MANSTNKGALADQLKAMAHPVRLEILRLLADRGACICGELVDHLPFAQSTVSQHLKVLKEAAFITATADGPKSCYRLDPRTLHEVRLEIARLLGGWHLSSCRLRVRNARR